MSETQALLMRSLSGWWGSKPLAHPLCRSISSYSSNLLTICHSLIRARSVSRSSNHARGSEWITSGQKLLPPAENSLPFLLSETRRQRQWFAVTDGGEAWKSWASQTTHQDLFFCCQLKRTSGSYASWIWQLKKKKKNGRPCPQKTS